MPKSNRSAFSASKACTTTCGISSAAGVSTPTPRFPRDRREQTELTAAGRQRSVAFQSRRLHRRLLDAGRRRRPRGALPARHPDGVGTLVFEVEDIERRSSCSSARRHADRRHRDVQGRRRHAARLLDHDAVRRHHVPLLRAPRLRATVPGCGARPAARRARTRSVSSASITSPRTSRP